MTTYLELLSSNLVFKSHLGADLIFEVKYPQLPPSPGGLRGGRGLYFGGRWVVASFLKLLAQTLFGYEFKSLELNQLHPPGREVARGRGPVWGRGSYGYIK